MLPGGIMKDPKAHFRDFKGAYNEFFREPPDSEGQRRKASTLELCVVFASGARARDLRVRI